VVGVTSGLILAFADCYYMYSDYNYVRHDNECVPVGPEPIEAGVCTGNPDQTYMGSSGYRLVPGNTCNQATGVKKDTPISKKCSQGSCCYLSLVLRRLCGRESDRNDSKEFARYNL
jgi:hypothetical protein